MDNLGQRLKAARLRGGLTLRELARQAEVSPSLVSLIENGKSQPSVATLYTFAHILDVSVDELFEQSQGAEPVVPATLAAAHGVPPVMDPVHAWEPSEYANRISVAHPSHRPQLAMAAGVVWERLAATPEKGVNFMKITYQPQATSTAGGELLTHDGYEYGYVVSGEVEVTVGEELFTLRVGESLGFDSSIPHVLRNSGDVPFEGIWFVHGGHH
ncbi:helix-turn-helix domain-containing protein [Nocardioides plantarum]|uniref:Helix-turn-helix domain-containing protein n=1 Tax=Nocardioides plantarum TaxID=29299 RepID=A0ABV5KHI8_9ACTN|nr:helix-turn-helix domain-containing protein [Nocardioides plantarum]